MRRRQWRRPYSSGTSFHQQWLWSGWIVLNWMQFDVTQKYTHIIYIYIQYRYTYCTDSLLFDLLMHRSAWLELSAGTWSHKINFPRLGTEGPTTGNGRRIRAVRSWGNTSRGCDFESRVNPLRNEKGRHADRRTQSPKRSLSKYIKYVLRASIHQHIPIKPESAVNLAQTPRLKRAQEQLQLLSHAYECLPLRNAVRESFQNSGFAFHILWHASQWFSDVSAKDSFF